MKFSKSKVSIIVVLLFHAVGLAGFLVPALTPLFLQLVPLHLMLMMSVLIWSHKAPDIRFVQFALLVFSAGMGAEWIGVHKNWVFGNYYYGKTLGPKLDGIPFTIGMNWFALVYACGVLLQYTGIKSTWLRILTGGIVLVMLDLLIEPVAIRFDYWHWADNIIPFKNYVCWFLVSALFLLLFESFKFKKQGLAGPVLLIVQFVFFALLQWA